MRFDLRPGVRRWFRLPLRSPASIHADVDDELESLLASRVDDFVARGMSPEDARSEALRRLGISLDSARNQLHTSAERRERHMRFNEYLEDLAHDLRYAARGLVRRPAFTIVAVSTLAIGIGATTAIFSAVNTLLFRQLPYAAPDQLMAVSLTTPNDGDIKGRNDMVWSYPKYLVFRDGQTVFSNASLYESQQFTATNGDVEQIPGEYVGATYLRTLGLAPIRGRDFDVSIDAHVDAEKQAVISHSLWQRRYNADPDIIGKSIELNRAGYTIIGVGPEAFRGLTGQAELFVPITTRSGKDDLDEARSHEFYLVARRKPGIDAATASASVKVLGQRIREVVPDQRTGNGKWGAGAQPLNDVRIAPLIRRSLFILLGAVSLVLLIACVNVANLMVGRASVRRREIAVRLAIGASRARLVRLLLTESMLLAAAGGVASILVALVGVRALSTINPATTLRVARFGGVGSVTFSSVHLDWTALAFALGVTALVGVVFGLIPALDATRASVANSMKASAVDHRGRVSASRRTLVIVEVAMAMVLLAGSGLMIRSLGKLLSIDTGFDERNVLTARLTIPPGGMARDSLPGFYMGIVDRLHAIPGVTDVSLGNCAPLSGGCNSTRMELLDRPKVEDSQMPSVGVSWATPTWFSTLHIPVKRGRVFTAADRMGTAKVVIINETAARAFWPGGDAMGRRVGVGQGGFSDGAEIVGIVGDVRQNVDSLPHPEVYLPYLQAPNGRVMIFLRTAGDPSTLGTDVRRVVREVAPRYALYDMKAMATRTAAATAQARFSATLLGLFAATALSLATIGIYGVMSLAVAARTREIGIRIALGADQRRVRHLVVWEGLGLVGVGAAIGIGGALAFSRVLQSMLFDLTPSDPLTYVGMVALLGAAATAASWIPARRASRVDPVTALRAD